MVEEASNSNSKLNLYVIKEIKDEPVQHNNVHSTQSPTPTPPTIGLTSPLLINDGTLMSLADTTTTSQHTSLYPQSFIAASNGQCLLSSVQHDTASTSTTSSSAFITNNDANCLQAANPGAQPTHYFLTPPTDAILYATASALQPQILSINEKVRCRHQHHFLTHAHKT